MGHSAAIFVTFRLAFIAFFIDLSPDVSLFHDLKIKAQEIYGESGFGFTPIDA